MQKLTFLRSAYGVPTNPLQTVAPTGAVTHCPEKPTITAPSLMPFVVDAVDDGCTGSVRIINRPLELPIGPNESMDHTCRIGVRADHLSLVIQTKGLRGRSSWKGKCFEHPLVEQETVHNCGLISIESRNLSRLVYACGRGTGRARNGEHQEHASSADITVRVAGRVVVEPG